MSDFSVIGNLPKMYAHCKATEDKDMTPFDFVTDHLINIDSLFDKHENGDEQKPHKSSYYTLHHTATSFYQEFKSIEFKRLSFEIPASLLLPSSTDSLYFHNYIFFIFRPPISL